MARLRQSKVAITALLFVVCAAISVSCGGSGGGGGGGNGGGGGPSGCIAADPGHTAVSSGGTTMTGTELQAAEWVFAIVNAERVARGLSPLAWRDDLAEVAYQHSLWQRDVNGNISHDGPGTCTSNCLALRLNNAGIPWSAAGENVAGGQTTPQQVMCTSWMNSPGHLANITNGGFTHIGVAVAWGGGFPAPVWTQVFITP